MSSQADQTLRRQLFLAPDATAETATSADAARRLLQLLLAQDGSTTRLCEVVAGGPVQLHVRVQRVVDAVPDAVAEQLPGTRFIERITCLAAHGEVMMDNLAYIALEGLPEDIRRDLVSGTIPIGHLLARLWVRRRFLAPTPTPLLDRLWSTVGLPDPAASRAYCVTTPEGPRMLIAETYRRGMRMGPPER